ncbi:hypothetical protein DB354_12690 [Opitutus sp. ER46]|nr:hypothetical protein DB354_12690 [Opitutus sp. ER46]
MADDQRVVAGCVGAGEAAPPRCRRRDIFATAFGALVAAGAAAVVAVVAAGAGVAAAVVMGTTLVVAVGREFSVLIDGSD